MIDFEWAKDVDLKDVVLDIDVTNEDAIFYLVKDRRCETITIPLSVIENTDRESLKKALQYDIKKFCRKPLTVARHSDNRVVTYLNDKTYSLLAAVCEDREEKEAVIVREAIMFYLQNNSSAQFILKNKK